MNRAIFLMFLLEYLTMNNFYILRGSSTTATRGAINPNTGQEITTSKVNHYRSVEWLSDFRPSNKSKAPIVTGLGPDIIGVSNLNVYYYDEKANYLGYSTNKYTNYDLFGFVDGSEDVEADSVLRKAKLIKFDFDLDITEKELNEMSQTDIQAMLTRVWLYAGFQTYEPHYTKLEKKYKKETGQMFFRDSVDGSIKIFGNDADFIKNASIESKFLFIVARKAEIEKGAALGSKCLSVNQFTKTSCKFDYTRHSVELKLSALDRYSKIMNNYDSEYDLIKLAPAITPLTLTKRLLYQFYIQGADSISCYANGTYWEQDVNESVDDPDLLKNKYYFAENLSLQEFTITDEMSPEWAGTYKHSAGDPPATWVNQTRGDGKIRMEAISDLSHTKSDAYGNRSIRWFNTGKVASDQEVGAIPDSWKFALKIYNSGVFGNQGVAFSTDIYALSTWQQAVDTAHMGNDTTSVYRFEYTPSGSTTAKQFTLDVIDYTIWGRILADVDTAIEPSTGQTKTLYDLPKDDFVSERANYLKCIGLVGLNVVQSSYTVDYPTKFGRNDYGKYFSSNFVSAVTRTSHKPVPISRSTWANTSIWAIIPDNWSAFEGQFRKRFILKDAFALSDAIKALLRKIDPSVKFEATAEYSRFLYEGDSSHPIISFDGSRVGYVPFIAPKSNVLKGNYDQAAQKAEITFEQIMDMLRDCFRCYWFIDDQSRLRIEHARYFMNGGSYDSKETQLDLTSKQDKFNKKFITYAQESVEYDTEDLNSRYEFAWMDDSTETFEDITIDVNSEYVQEDKTEDINSEVFSTDIDLMLYAPDKFSSDGFALMMANKDTGIVPISSVSSLRDDEYIYEYSVLPQNYLLSWLYLARYYMYDMPARKITYTRAPSTDAYRPVGIKQCMKQNITFQVKLGEDIDLTKAIKTTVGAGVIDSLTVNLDTLVQDATLVFEPK